MDSLIKRTGVLIIPFRGYKKALLITLRVFSFKRSTAGALTVSFRELSQETMTGDNVRCKNWYLLGGGGTILSHAHKTGS